MNLIIIIKKLIQWCYWERDKTQYQCVQKRTRSFLATENSMLKSECSRVFTVRRMKEKEVPEEVKAGEGPETKRQGIYPKKDK